MAEEKSAAAGLPERIGPMQRDPKAIGGSDAAAICGDDPNKTAYSVALRIAGQIQSDELEGLDHIEIGNLMEGVMAGMYEKKQKCKLYTPQNRRHPQYPFLSANIDRVREDRLDIGIEMKNVGLYTREAWGEPMTDAVPKRVLLQCWHYMLVCPEIREFHVPRIYGGNQYQMFVIPRNEAGLDALLGIELEFYERVMRGQFPEPDWGHRTTSDLIKRAFKKIKGTIEHMPQLDTWTANWEVAAAERLRYQKLEEGLKNQIEHMMGNNEVAILSDGRRWRRKQITKKAYAVEAATYIEARLVKE